MKVTVHAGQFKVDQKLESFIGEKLQKLQLFYNGIQEVHVYLKLESSSSIKEKVVETKLLIPNDTIINKEKAQTFEAAVDLSIDSLKKQLVKAKEKLQAQRK